MPEYSYICDTDEGGCGHSFSVFQKISEYKRLKRCPNCKKHKLIRCYDEDNVHGSMKVAGGGMTLGHLADTNASKMSTDQKASMHKKHNAYKSSESKLPDGMKRKKTQEKPWYKTSNFSDIKNMSETQKKNYIRTGKKNG